MSVRTVPSRWLRSSLLTALVTLSLLTCTGASTPGSESSESTAKLESLRSLEQKTLSMVPALVEATVGLSSMGGMAAGSGVIVSEDGLILSAAHVVPVPGQIITVYFSNGKKVSAKTLGSDKQIDAGMAQITEPGKYPFVKMGKSANLKKGDWVLAIGNPGGYNKERKPPIRLGRVLSLPNRDANAPWIRTDASVAPGDSGGPLFNMEGEVVGIHSNISPDPSENRHVAVDDFTKRMDLLMSKKTVGKMFDSGRGSRAQLGIMPVDSGGKVRIGEIIKGSNAEKAGFKLNDIILKINDNDIERADQVYERLRNKKSGNEIRVLVEREGEELEIIAKMGEGPRTFETPSDDMLGFLKKFGYQRPDGVWEYQETEESKPEYKKIVDAANERRNKAFREMRFSKDVIKNSPQLVEALNSVTKPINNSIALIFNNDPKEKGEFEEKPSVLGTVISPDGYILTKASELREKFYCKIGDQELDAKLIGRRDDFDLALLKVDAKNLLPIKWASQSDPTPGALLLSPTLHSSPEKQVSLSIVSNAPRKIPRVPGLNRAVIGIQFEGNGEAKIGMVTANGPAAKAGLQKGDIIISLNGKAITSREQMQDSLQPMKPGEKIKLEVKRKNAKEDKTETLKFEVKLGSRNEIFPELAGGRSELQAQMFESAANVSSRKENFPEALTHDAALTAKQMGGPLLNLAGQAIGVNIARFDRTGSYAIPYKSLQPIIEKMIEEGKK
ncbi:MAG: trypsin-like peptidase domain-containing protein [Gemmatales bacterium]